MNKNYGENVSLILSFVLRNLPAIRAAKAMMFFIVVFFLMICLEKR